MLHQFLQQQPVLNSMLEPRDEIEVKMVIKKIIQVSTIVNEISSLITHETGKIRLKPKMVKVQQGRRKIVDQFSTTTLIGRQRR